MSSNSITPIFCQGLDELFSHARKQGFILPDTIRTALRQGDSRKTQGRCATTDKPDKQNGQYTLSRLDKFWELFVFNYRTQKAALLTNATSSLTAKERRAREDRKRTYTDEMEQGYELHLDELAAAYSRMMPIMPHFEIPYVNEKGLYLSSCVRLYGRDLVVPFYDRQGRLANLQTIRQNGDKRSEAGLPTKDLYHIIEGEPTICRDVFVVEGYATGCSVWRAMFGTVIVAGSADKLYSAAEYAKERYSESRVFICADNDAANENNTGEEKARYAAEKLGCYCAVPPSEGKENVDFNDLDMAAGPKAVRAAIQVSKENGVIQLPKDFALRENQLCVSVTKKIGSLEFPQWVPIGDRLEVVALARMIGKNSWGKLLRWKDPNKGTDMEVIMNEDLASPNKKWLQQITRSYQCDLSRQGDLLRYISTCAPAKRVHIATHNGWIDNGYVLPDKVIGDGALDIIPMFNSLPSDHSRKGTLEEWQKNVASYAEGNPILLTGLCVAFAGPLVRLANLGSSGVHFIGHSSVGKSISATVAQSVWTGPLGCCTWRTTDNALEFMAARHNDRLMVLDELSQASPKTVANACYMLFNGQGKGRCNSGSRGVREVESKQWTGVFISTGEEDIDTIISRDDPNQKVKAGQQVRMVGIPVTSNSIRDLHGHESSQALMDGLKQNVAKYHGTAGPCFVDYLTANLDVLRSALPNLIRARENTWSSEHPGCSNQLKRVRIQFELYKIAGQLASAFGVLPISEEGVDACIETVFESWVVRRGSREDSEVRTVLRTVRGYIDTHGERFVPLVENPNPRIPDPCAGFKTADTDERRIYYFFLDFFDKEVTRGLDTELCLSILNGKGCLDVLGARKKQYQYRIDADKIIYGSKRDRRKYTYAVDYDRLLACLSSDFAEEETPTQNGDSNDDNT